MTDLINWGIATPLSTDDVMLTVDDLAYVLSPIEAEAIGSALVTAGRERISNKVNDLAPGTVFWSGSNPYVRGFGDKVAGIHHDYRVEDFAPPLHTEIEVRDSD